MDTGYDYLTPEFLNLIFFQQKNLVIFPYLDLKHLHTLELFTVGYNIIDLDATAITDIIDILEHESYNSYSQNPTLFFISNVTKQQLQKIVNLEFIHCIINTNENLDNIPIDGKHFVVFNKKNKKFLNFNQENIDLNFETWLIKTSQNQSILQDNIIKIKSIATQLFTVLNQDADKKQLIQILSEYEKKYWDKIILFTENYYQIVLPQLPRVRMSMNSVIDEPLDEHLDPYLQEYELIMKSNTNIASEFVLAMHEYRSQKVNPANLELMELFSPRQLYCYLRTHHWDQGIPEEFVQEWVSMKNTHYPLSDLDHKDFLTLFSKLNISSENIDFPEVINQNLAAPSVNNEIKKSKNEIISNYDEPTSIPSIHNFSLFREWVFNKLEQIETRLKSLKNKP